MRCRAALWVRRAAHGRDVQTFQVISKGGVIFLMPERPLSELKGKVLKRDASEEDALQAIAQMLRTNVVPLSETLALEAADKSLEHSLAMADAIVYATARSRGAELVTTDADLERLPGVLFLSKKRS